VAHAEQPPPGSTHVLVEHVDGVHHVRLDRPARRNAVSEELYTDLDPALRAGLRDPATRAVLLSGAGPSFCAGADLKAHAERSRTPAEQRAYVWAGQRVCRSLRTAEVPVVAAVQGHAIGAGAELALAADVVVVGHGTRLAFPEVELGTFVGGGASVDLPRRLGPARAAEVLLLGRRLDGAEAVAWGLATEVVDDDLVLDRAFELARELAARPATSVALAKAALARAGIVSLDDALTYEAEALLACMATEDWADGVAAFTAREPGRDGP
jgi:enoyl-CoA hydratase/carnithine racemase